MGLDTAQDSAADGPAEPAGKRARRSGNPQRIIAAVIAGLVALGTAALVAQIGTGAPALPPVHVGAESPTDEAVRHCPGFLALAPDEVAGMERREVTGPAEYALAWGDPAVVVRCGAPAPVDLEQTSPLLTIDGVAWFQQQGRSGVRWTAVGRDTFVDVTFPASAESGSSHESVLVPVGRMVSGAIP